MSGNQVEQLVIYHDIFPPLSADTIAQLPLPVHIVWGPDSLVITGISPQPLGA